MELTTIHYFLFWVWFGGILAVSEVATEKNLSMGKTIALAILFTPFIAAIYVIGTPKNGD